MGPTGNTKKQSVDTGPNLNVNNSNLKALLPQTAGAQAQHRTP